MTIAQHHVLTASLKLIAERHNIRGDDWLERLHALYIKNKWPNWPREI